MPAFYRLLVVDGQEVGAHWHPGAALVSDVNQCPVCTCHHSELESDQCAISIIIVIIIYSILQHGISQSSCKCGPRGAS